MMTAVHSTNGHGYILCMSTTVCCELLLLLSHTFTSSTDVDRPGPEPLYIH